MRERGNAGEVVEGLRGCCSKDARYFPEPIILCDLEEVDEALLPPSGVPNRGAVREDGDDQGVVYLAPVEEVEALDQVAEDADPAYGGAGAVGHDLDVWLPVKVTVDEHPQEAEGGGGGDVLGS